MGAPNPMAHSRIRRVAEISSVIWSPAPANLSDASLFICVG